MRMRSRDAPLVVVDEAYIEFAGRESLAREVQRRPQLAVLRTLSKAHGPRRRTLRGR